MPEIELEFEHVNQSLQVGDIAYYTTTNETGGFDFANNNNIVKIGVVVGVLGNIITIDLEPGISEPSESNDYWENNFILFSKDSTVNTSSVLGYYAEVEFRNNSKEPAELYATSCEISESSK
tara:strand:+ start:221 stop:586 length:366 start_codon:yes stop_codon:yes gene_type:complete